jgi:hypothetical protein
VATGIAGGSQRQRCPLVPRRIPDHRWGRYSERTAARYKPLVHEDRRRRITETARNTVLRSGRLKTLLPAGH